MKRLSTVVLECYLYVGVSLCSFCGFNFFFFGRRTVLGFDACHLFPQHMLAIFPLMGCAVVWVYGMCILQEGTWLPVMGALAVVVSQAYFKEGGGSDLHQLTAPLEMVVASVRACL